MWEDFIIKCSHTRAFVCVLFYKKIILRIHSFRSGHYNWWENWFLIMQDTLCSLWETSTRPRPHLCMNLCTEFKLKAKEYFPSANDNCGSNKGEVWKKGESICIIHFWKMPWCNGKNLGWCQLQIFFIPVKI